MKIVGITHDGSYGSGRFCSCKCARGFSTKTKRSEINTKVSLKLKVLPSERYCADCGSAICNYKHNLYCKSCAAKRKYMKLRNAQLVNADDIIKERLLYQEYRRKCSFNFAISDYHDEFDLELLKRYGWYSATNHGNNMTGVSRDHIYSVFEGYKNRVDPKIISHPANCQLLLQSDNASKKTKCDITLDELKLKIDKWNKKYGLVM